MRIQEIADLFDRRGLRRSLPLVRTVTTSLAHRRPVAVRRREGALTCRYPRGVVTFAGMAPPHRLESDIADTFFFDYTPRAGDIVVDAGAGIGTETLPLSWMVGPTGLVIAVEAHPATFTSLRTLCRLNQLENVILVQAALSDLTGEVAISDLDEPELNSIVATGEAAVRVRARTLDGVLCDAGVEHVDFLKMNIEGAEARALAGFVQGLARTTNVAISCHDFLADDGRGTEAMRTKSEVRDVLENAGFSIRSRSDDRRPWIADYLYGHRERER